MKNFVGAVMLTLVASFTLLGAQAKQADPQIGGGAMPAMMQMMQDCPMNVPGTEIAVADTPTGIALTLTTKTGAVEELRRRAERMATMHGSPAENAMPMTQGSMMAGSAKYEAISNGARLTLTPKDPATLSEFRKQVRSRVEHMASMESGCSNMQGMMQGMMGGMGKASTEARPEPRKDESEVDHSAHHPGEKP
jgi:hypothetical protein